MVPEEYHDIFARLAFAHVATVGPDGTPQITPVWIELDDAGNPRFSTTKGRAKYRNLVRNPKVGLSVLDPDDPYRYVQVRGRAQITDDPDKSLIHNLTRKYTGAERFENDAPGVERVIVTVLSDNVICKTDA